MAPISALKAAQKRTQNQPESIELPPRPLAEIQENVRAHEGLRAAIGDDLCSALRAADGSDYAGALRRAFTALMSRGKDDLRGPLESHRAKVASKADKDAADELFLRLRDYILLIC